MADLDAEAIRWRKRETEESVAAEKARLYCKWLQG